MNWPVIFLALAVLGLPFVMISLAKLNDWLEASRLGDWVRKQEQKYK